MSGCRLCNCPFPGVDGVCALCRCVSRLVGEFRALQPVLRSWGVSQARQWTSLLQEEQAQQRARDRLCAPVGPPTTGGLPVPPPPPPRTEGIAVKREAAASAPSAPAEVAEAPSSSARGAREEAERSRSLQKPKKEKKKEKAEGKRSKARDSKTERGESPGRKERKERPRSKDRSGEESARGSREAFIDKRPVSRARSPRLEDRDRGRGRPREPEHPPRRWEGPILTVRRPIGEAEPRADPQRKRALNKGRKKRERQRAWREDRAQG